MRNLVTIEVNLKDGNKFRTEILSRERLRRKLEGGFGFIRFDETYYNASEIAYVKVTK